MNILERIYLFFYLKKKQKALKNQKVLPYPVVSVGNLTFGGTGKTPFTVELAKMLIEEGYFPVILTRGYRGSIKGPYIVKSSDSVEEVGDEAFMMVEEGLTVVKGVDRYKAGVYATENLNLGANTVFVLDDGFQHWSLRRDLNILLIDGYKDFDKDHLIPLGSLRSPLSEISEADIIFITKRKNMELYEKLRKKTEKSIYFAPLKVKGIFNSNGDIIFARGQRVFAFAGIGNFQSFITLVKENFRVEGYKKFIDHKKYSKNTLERIQKLAKHCELIITTKKDFVKIKQIKQLPNNFCYIDVAMEIEKDAKDELLLRIKKLHEKKRRQPALSARDS